MRARTDSRGHLIPLVLGCIDVDACVVNAEFRPGLPEAAPLDLGGRANADWVSMPRSGCQLLHSTVISAQMDGGDQTLRLGLSDGSTVTVQRDRPDESWNLAGTGVPAVLVTPT